MSSPNGPNQSQTIPLLDLPLKLQEAIVAKMTYETYTKFVQTCNRAQVLCVRNNHFAYHTDIKKLMIQGDRVYVDELTYLSFEEAKKMRFTEAEVIVDFLHWLSPKTNDFLLGLGKIKTLECHSLNFKANHGLVDFFKNTKIEILKITTVGQRNAVQNFPYDTSNVDKVIIDNCCWFNFDVVNSIKARKEVSLSDVRFTSGQIFSYMKRSLESGQMVDLTVKRYFVKDHQKIINFIQSRCTAGAGNKWILKRGEEQTPFMSIEMIGFAMHFRRC